MTLSVLGEKRGCRMVKNALCLFVFGFCGGSFLSAQEGFLAGVTAEDLRLAGIETRIQPSDTVGYGEAGVLEFFSALDSISPAGDAVAYVRRRPLLGQFYQGRQIYGEFELWLSDLSGEKIEGILHHGVTVRSFSGVLVASP